MTAYTLQTLFLAFFLFSVTLKLLLSIRQSLCVAKHRNKVPDDFSQTVTLEEHQKAADYTQAKQRFARYQILYEAFLLLVFVLGGGLNWLAVLSKGLVEQPLWQGVLLCGLFIFVNMMLSLPFDYYRTFKLEHHFGFNRTTKKVFSTDFIKALILIIVLGCPLITAVLYLMGVMGELWWFYVWLLWLGFSFIMMWAFPTFIAPLFNKFEPLSDQKLKAAIEQLLVRTNFTSKGIFVMDSSKRSGHGNAYFTGLGNNKRIVFFDTLLKELDADEIEAVLAHELGHFKYRHILKGMIFSFALSLLILFILGQLMNQPVFFQGFRIDFPSHAMALLLFFLVLPVFTFPFSPISSIFSRKNEYAADRFARENTQASALIHALTKLYKSNASTLTPDSWYSHFYDSHPNASERITALKAPN